ncbi:CoA-binding domain protein [Nitrolancea hollandica]|uniref:CoA-binding domain protein n=1 Tax=Nitrolancea hollandica Lb TaxID=1129897 RepID=I4EHQ3_9BACT|nr:CoA-binding domain protein [Nitrolancea hollandica]CCF84215.1 CoA-binding domain protein [Nitrolancea hollandica Lb]
MSVLVSETTSVVVVGIDDPKVQATTRQMIVYGTRVVAGVAAGGAGPDVAGVPVYRTLAEAVNARQPNAAMISVSLAAVLDACLEALSHRIHLLVISTCGVPERATSLIADRAREAMVRVIGPGSGGIISPAVRVRIGTIGGDDPDRAFSPGRIGVITGGGEAAAGIGRVATTLRLGVSTAISTGADGLTTTSPARLLPLFESDRKTSGVVLDMKAIAGSGEAIAEMLRSRRYTKPLLVAASRLRPTVEPGAAHLLTTMNGTAQPDIESLRELGALIAERPGDLEQLLSLTFLSRPYLGNPLDAEDDR